MNRVLCLLGVLTLSFSSIGAELTGKVCDEKGKPLEGIRVTDGFTVTLTSKHGEYSLDAQPRSTIISVVTPADKKTDAFWLPIESEKSSGYDFVLSSRPRRKAFSFIQISDEEDGIKPNTPFYEAVRDRALAEDVAFVISSGDLCYEGGIRSAGESMRAENFGGIPAYITLGNHDLIGENGSGERFYEQQCGPTRYAFIEGNVLFIVLPMCYGDRKPSFTLDDIALFTKSMLATWEKGRPVFFVCHSYRSFLNGSLTFAPTSKYAFSLADWKMSGFIYGHSHWYLAYPDEPVPVWNTGQSSRGGGGNMPGSMRIFNIDAAGNCTSKLAESNVPPHLTGLCAPDGTITAVAFATAGVVSKVTANVRGKTVPLKQQNSWLWSGKCSSGTDNFSLNAELKIGRDTRMLNAECKSAPSFKLERIIALKEHMIFGTPVINEGKIIVGVVDEDNSRHGGVIAFDAKRGKKVWEFRTGFSVRNSVVAKDGIIYACDANNTVYKLNGKTGKLIWRNSEQPNVYEDNCHSAPCLGEGKVFAGCGTVLRAIDDESGKTLWKASKFRDEFATVMGPIYSNGKVFIDINWGYLNALDAKTGKLLWNTETAESKRGFHFQPSLAILEDGSVIRCEGTHGVSLFNPDNGELIREMEKPEILSTASKPLVYKDTVFCGASAVGVCAVDLNTMKTKWKLADTMKNSVLSTVQYRGPGKIMEATPIIVGDKLVCAAGDGIIYVLNPDDGSIFETFDTGAPLLGAPLFNEGKLYVADYTGRILIFAVNSCWDKKE